MGGGTIALNDIWVREIYLKSISWINEFNYKLEYQIILWDHFGLDLPDLEKLFNILPITEEIFACWLLLQHYYGYRPFITKASFLKEFSGDTRVSSMRTKLAEEYWKEERERQKSTRSNDAKH